MQKLKVFLVLTGYQITWLACVFGENKINQPMLGIYIGSLYLVLYFYFSKNKLKFTKISFLIFLPGYLFDSIMVYFSIYEFNTSTKFGILPIWMIILWLSFSTLFDEILMFFRQYKILGIFLSLSIGPLTYYLGKPMGIIYIDNIFIFFVLMIIFWALLMVYYLEIILRKF